MPWQLSMLQLPSVFDYIVQSWCSFWRTSYYARTPSTIPLVCVFRLSCSLIHFVVFSILIMICVILWQVVI